MKKRPDEKFSLLQKIGTYHIKLDMLESMYFKTVHKKHQIAIWIQYPKKDQNSNNIVSINEYHEVRTEKDIQRYFTLLCDKFKKKFKPLEDKRKVCIANFKGNEIMLLTAPSLLEAIKHNLSSIQSLHFIRNDLTMQTGWESGNFSYYMFALRLDEERSSDHNEALSSKGIQKQGKGQGINHLIRGFGLDKGEYDYHLIQIVQSKDGQETLDVWDKTVRYKIYNYVSNLLYIFEKKENLIIERMNLYFIINNESQIFMFDIDKCLLQEPRKVKSDKDEGYFIDGLKPDVSLLPPTFLEPLKATRRVEDEDQKKKRMKRFQEQQQKEENFIIKNIKKLRTRQSQTRNPTQKGTTSDLNIIQRTLSQFALSPLSSYQNQESMRMQAIQDQKQQQQVQSPDQLQKRMVQKNPSSGIYLSYKTLPGAPAAAEQSKPKRLFSPQGPRKININNYFMQTQLDRKAKFHDYIISQSALKYQL